MKYNVPIHEMVVGDRYEGFYLLVDPAQKVGANGKPFLAAKLSDKTGTIDLKVWDYTGPFRAEDSGCIVKVRGNLSEYRGTPQFTAELIREPRDDDKYDVSSLVPTAPIDVEPTVASIKAFIGRMQNPQLKAVCSRVLDEDLDRFVQCPAAKSVHHAFLHGLLMHTNNMLNLATCVSVVYAGLLDNDLLIAGTFLHDIGKLNEFTLSPLGLVKEYSVEGQLLGHLVMGAQRVASLCDECGVDHETSILLQHMLLSHHGEPEYGAAIVPKTAEAELLHLIDKIDATMETYRENLADVGPGEFSGRIFSLGKKIYNHGTKS